jgi:hypothetical protein
MKPQDDLTIAEIREVRHLISEECGHDPDQVIAYYLEMQRQYDRRLLKQSEADDEKATPVEA